VWFSAVRDNGQSQFWEDFSADKDIVFNKALINQGGDYNTNTGVFTCRVTGSYYIRYDLQVLYRDDEITTSGVNLLHNGTSVTSSWMSDGATASRAAGVLGFGLVLQLKKGDKVWARTWYRSRFYWRYDGGYASTFSGYLLK